MAAPRVIRYLRRLAGRQAGLGDGRAPAIGRRHRQLLVDSGRVLMLLGVLVLVQQLSTRTCAPLPNEAEVERALVLLGFLLWLLGAAVAMLTLAARRFPALVAAAVAGAVALALRVYLFGGGVYVY